MAKYLLRKRVARLLPPYDRMGVKLYLEVLSEAAGSDSLSETSDSSVSLGPLADPAILLFRGPPADPVFLGVCSPLDMETWPADEPAAEGGLHRRSAAEFTFRAEAIIDTFWTCLTDDVRSLLNAWQRLLPLREEETIIYDFSSADGELIRKYQLLRDPLLPYPEDRPAGYRLRVSCIGEGDVDANIFLHRNDVSPTGGDGPARAIAVCSPGDLVDYPAGEADGFPRHYRRAVFDIVSRNLRWLHEGWANIKTDTAHLAAALRRHADEAVPGAEEEYE